MLTAFSYSQLALLYLELFNHTPYLVFILALNGWISNFLLLVFICLFSKKAPYKNKLVYFILSLLIYFGNRLNLVTFQLRDLIIPLWVGTINIHPVLFYLTLILLCHKLFYISSFTTLNAESWDFKRLLGLGVFSLFLGGLWGLQSLSWGYLWVDDGIEWVLFFICTYICYLIHKLGSHNLVLNIIAIPVILVIFLLFIRLGLIATRHSFFLVHQLLYPLLNFYIITFFLFLYINLFSKRTLKTFNSLLRCLPLLVLIYTLCTHNCFKYILGYTLYFFLKTPSSLLSNFRVFFIHFFSLWFAITWACGFFFFLLYFKLYFSTESLPNLYLKVYQSSENSYVYERFLKQPLEIVSFVVSNQLNKSCTLVNFLSYFLFLSAPVFILLASLTLIFFAY